MRRLGYVPALDGLRAVSIALVVSAHAFGFPVGGRVGVDVFFVLSGYLITTLLLEERAATGKINLRAFYGRRFRRLFPALAFMLVVYLLVTAAAGRNDLLAAIVGGSYVANLFDASGNSLLVHAHLNQLWSLAQEEQFYLVWPAVLIGLARGRTLLRIVIAGLVAVTIVRAALVLDGASAARLYYRPDMRADALLLGVAIAIVQSCRMLRVPTWAEKVGLVGLLLGGVAGWGFRGWLVWGEPLFLLTVAALLLAALSATDLACWLAVRPLVWLGRRSYSLYLWHPPVIAATAYLLGGTPGAKVTGVLVAIGIATFSYRFVEQPFRRSGPTREAQPTLPGVPQEA